MKRRKKKRKGSTNTLVKTDTSDRKERKKSPERECVGGRRTDTELSFLLLTFACSVYCEFNTCFFVMTKIFDHYLE